MKQKEWLMVIFGVLFLMIILGGVFWAKPTLVNNNYSLQVPNAIMNAPADYRINQQLEVYKKELREEYNRSVEDLNSKFNALISVLGIAVMVWVGLNISSLIDRRDLDKLIAKEKELAIQLEIKSKEVERITSQVATLNEDIEQIKRKMHNDAISRTMGAI